MAKRKEKRITWNIKLTARGILTDFNMGFLRYVVYATLQWYRLAVPLYTKKYKKQGESADVVLSET